MKTDLASTMNENLTKQLDFQKSIFKRAADDSTYNTIKDLLVLASNCEEESTKQELQTLALAIADEANENCSDLFGKFGLK